ncbi:MAG: WD40/YVTN/BNR-like repeat-containing protein, partial [Halolamina sp.]
MLFAGTDDGIYRLSGIEDGDDTTVQKIHDGGEVMRLRRFDAYDGVFAATESGLYHSLDGEDWTNLNVPEEKVYSVAADSDGRLYAGTRPAHVYAASPDETSPVDGTETPQRESAWQELDGFRDLPSQSDWQLPRHDDLAQVRDLHAPAGAPGRVVAGVEVGGVHLSDDGGETWIERRDGVDDDIHELHVVGPAEYLAATGFGLFRTTDAGESWTRLDDGFDQRYFRSAAAVDGDLYAGANVAHTATWSDEDADAELFRSSDGERLEPVDHPRPAETVTGLAGIDGYLVAATYHGTVMLETDEEWRVLGSLSAPGEPAGSYIPLCWFD